MDLQLQGKVALITGGSRGIGKAIAEKFLDEGVRVAIAARDQNRLADTVTKLDEKYTGQISGYICDTRDLSSIQQMVSEITNRWGDINILVNNAAEPGGPRPVLSEIDGKIHQYGDECYKYDLIHTSCDANKKIVPIEKPE